MDPRTVGLIGGIAGGVLGILGGAVGTYFSIRNTSGARERSFMIGSAALCWALVTSFLVALWLLPHPYRFLIWLPYMIVLPVFIRVGNRRQEQIRRDEAAGG